MAPLMHSFVSTTTRQGVHETFHRVKKPAKWRWPPTSGSGEPEYHLGGSSVQPGAWRARNDHRQE